MIMRLEWLEDILAVLETGSLARAGEQRLLTQPAFSRRIKLIEKHIGVELFDRSKKPAQMKKSVVDQQLKIQELVAGLHDLRLELKRKDREADNQVVIASQHAITTSVAPTLIRKLLSMGDINTQLRSANRDECYTLLMTKQVDFILVHQSENEQTPPPDGFLEQCNLGHERFIPVFATNELHKIIQEYENGDTPVVAYPSDAFLGQVVNREIFSKMWNTTNIHKKAETALTLAALHLALAGVGVAWLPYSLVASDIASGKLTELSNMFPSCELAVVAIRLTDNETATKMVGWNIVTSMDAI